MAVKICAEFSKRKPHKKSVKVFVEWLGFKTKKRLKAEPAGNPTMLSQR
nr:hypothetical protein [uncultured Campylobacter sp.]